MFGTCSGLLPTAVAAQLVAKIAGEDREVAHKDLPLCQITPRERIRRGSERRRNGSDMDCPAQAAHAVRDLDECAAYIRPDDSWRGIDVFLPERNRRINLLANGNPLSQSPREGLGHVHKTTEIQGHRQPRAAKLVYPADRGEPRAAARRVDPKYAPRLAPAITAIAISLVVSLVETIVRIGFTPALVADWLMSFGVSVIVAVPTAVLVAPRAQRLVSRITERSTRPGPPDGSITESEVVAGAHLSYSNPLTDPTSPVASADPAADDPIRTRSTREYLS
jgi:hypothetical protein